MVRRRLLSSWILVDVSVRAIAEGVNTSPSVRLSGCLGAYACYVLGIGLNSAQAKKSFESDVLYQNGCLL